MGRRNAILTAAAAIAATIAAGRAAPPAGGAGRPPELIIIADHADPPLGGIPNTDDDLPIVNNGFANDQDVDGPISPLVDALHAENFAQRVNAQEALLRLPPARLKDVVAALARQTDAEALERLTQVAAHLYLKPRTMLHTKPSLLGLWHAEPSESMLGIKFKMDPVKLQPTDPSPVMTVMVTEIQVGFPIMQTLRNGDRIVDIAGEGFPLDAPMLDNTYFRQRVAELWPGGVVPMTILRDGTLLKMDVQTTGLPLDGPASPADMVTRREDALQAFLRALKTADKPQAGFHFLAPAYNSPTRPQLTTSQMAARYSGRRF
jgi:hypothetical protein